jgi:hypothetical protein
VPAPRAQPRGAHHGRAPDICASTHDMKILMYSVFVPITLGRDLLSPLDLTGGVILIVSVLL